MFVRSGFSHGSVPPAFGGERSRDGARLEPFPRSLEQGALLALAPDTGGQPGTAHGASPAPRHLWGAPGALVPPGR